MRLFVCVCFFLVIVPVFGKVRLVNSRNSWSLDWNGDWGFFEECESGLRL